VRPSSESANPRARTEPVLAGITVLSFEHAVALPFATRQLADLGARIIKVERPGVGDFARSYDTSIQGQSSYFTWLNRGKESIELDLKSSTDLDLIRRIVPKVDIVAQNLAPGVAERLGLGTASLRAWNHDLITCSISGYGSGGPYGHRKAYDLLIQCETGLVATTGTANDMVKVGISIADIATGMYGYSGMLSALLRRSMTGTPSEVDVSMLDALGEWMLQPLYYSGLGDQEPRRTGLHHATIAPYGPFRLGDGSRIFLAIQSNAEWVRFAAKVLEDPDLAEDPRFTTNPDRVARSETLRDIIESAFSTECSDQVRARLDEEGIANAALRTPAGFVRHEQLVARDRWRTVSTPGGPVPALIPPVTLNDSPPVMGDIPALGEHTDRIRDEFGE